MDNLRGNILAGANLRGADLHRANLRGADLYGADLREAILHEAKTDTTTNFEGVYYNSATILPHGGFQFPASAVNENEQQDNPQEEAE